MMLNYRTPSSIISEMPFSNTLSVSGKSYTFNFTALAGNDAARLPYDGISAGNNTVNSWYDDWMYHEVIPNDEALADLQESSGSKGEVSAEKGLIRSYKVSSAEDITSVYGVIYLGSYYVSAASGKIQSLTDDKSAAGYTDIYTIASFDAGEGKTTAELQTIAAEGGTGTYYSFQGGGSYLVVQYLSPEDMVLSDEKIAANVRNNPLAATSKDVEADVAATIAYYHGVLNSRASITRFVFTVDWADDSVPNTLDVENLDNGGTSSTTTVPNLVAADGQSTIKIYYRDEDGNIIPGTSVSSNYGWPAGSTIGTPTGNLSVTAPAIPGYTYKSVSSTDSTSFNNDGTGSVAYPAAGTTTTVTYVYTANNQKVVYNVIDDTDKKNLATSQDFASGKSDANLPDTAQTDYDAIIKSYTDQGYELVPETTDPVPGVFDHDDADQVINIHLKHGTTTQEVTENVTRTVHYIVEGDLCEAPEDVKDTVYFTRTETRDSVSNAVIDAGQWTSDDACCDAVVSPKLENFTADTLVVPTIETVKPEDDDTTVNVLYTASLETTTETKNITETIHYVYEDGSEAAPDKTDKVSFTREVTTNLATGEVTYGAWTAENGDTTFDAVTSPLIDGYTADKLSVDAVTDLTADSEDAVTTVTYKKDAADPAPTPDPTDTPMTSSSTPKTTITVQPTSQTTKKSVLPSTGDEQRSMITVAGGLIILGAGLLGVIRHLRRKKQ
ncbi:mucin-binding protein [Lactovum odontotermitis]